MGHRGEAEPEAARIQPLVAADCPDRVLDCEIDREPQLDIGLADALGIVQPAPPRRAGCLLQDLDGPVAGHIVD